MGARNRKAKDPLAPEAKVNSNGRGGGEMWVEKILLFKKEGTKALEALHQKSKQAHPKDIPERFVDFLLYCVYTGADMVSRTILAEENVLVKPATAEDLANAKARWEQTQAYVGKRTPLAPGRKR